MDLRADPAPDDSRSGLPARRARSGAGESTPLECVALVAALAWSAMPAGSAWGLPAGLRQGPEAESGLISKADYDRMERGYYERLLAPDRSLDALADSPLAQNRDGLPRAEDVWGEIARLMLPVNDLRERVLRPDLATQAAGAAWTTNALGLRDGRCVRPKPPRTYRVALAGDSIAAGWGVDDGQGFEPLLEGTLGARSRQVAGPAVELVNLSVPGYSPGARWEQVRRLGWSLEPDLVLFEATVADFGWDERRLRWLLAWGIGWDAPQYRATLDLAGVRPGENARRYQRALKPYRERLLANVYQAAAAECRARGIPCVWVLLPRVGRRDESEPRARLLALARQSGFSAVVDVSDAYDGLAPEALQVGPGDYHPNAQGHARLAQKLDEELSRLPALEALTAYRGSAVGSPSHRNVGGGGPG
ncbi:MAG: SGNH/GDSL hydrolase family protein [Isosphaeraceae bacterium]|nr:SGNH/GDSL hydrolase family protein [Isosphaeraceae bacterium]